MVNEREQRRAKMRELILLAKGKEEYTKDVVMNIMCICCSEQMNEAGYTSEQALQKAIELVQTKEKQQVYEELLALTGYKLDN